MKSLFKSACLLIFLAAVVFNVGCAGRLVSMGPIDGQNFDATKGRSISASACGFQLFLLIPIRTNSRHERAYQGLVAQARGDYIADIKVQETWTWAFVGTVYCTKLEATAFPKIHADYSSSEK